MQDSRPYSTSPIAKCARFPLHDSYITLLARNWLLAGAAEQIRGVRAPRGNSRV